MNSLINPTLNFNTMKSIKYFLYSLVFVMTLSCDQEVIDLQEPEAPPVDTSCEDAIAGSADFTKFIAIGNSFVAGVQGGALFDDGQANSLPLIINKQLECAGASSTFNQPNINATLGWNLFSQPFLLDNTKPIEGRLLLQYSSSPSCKANASDPDVFAPKPTAQKYGLGDMEALPSPANTDFIYTGSKTALNNFGVPAIVLGQALIPQTGAWAGAASDPRFTPFYGRFAYPGTGTSTIIGDAAASGGTFFMFWLGLDDFFLYAAYGADPTKAPFTTSGNFSAQYSGAIGALLASNPDLKGVVGNFPDIFVMPHFTSVTYNPIPLDAATVGALTTGFAGFNGVLDAIIANPTLLTNFGLTSEDLTARKVSFSASCTNKILLNDETLTDLGPVLDYLRSVGAIDSDAKRNALIPYEQARQSTPADVFPLSTGSVLGTPGTFGVRGVSEPLTDLMAIVPTEKEAIIAARNSFNASVQATVDANPTRLALADVSGALATLVTNKAGVYNGVTITPNINPPTGIYSEDGVHPNTRGYAFISRTFIAAINAKFGSTIPLTDISLYSATGLPLASE
jgi:hypothetical protein